MAQVDIDKLSVTKTSWGDQFREAMNVNGGNLETAKASHYIGHAVAFFWKVIHRSRRFPFFSVEFLGSLCICSSTIDCRWLVVFLCLVILHRHSHCCGRWCSCNIWLFSRIERQYYCHFVRGSWNILTRYFRIDDRSEKFQDSRRCDRQCHRIEQCQRLFGSRLTMAGCCYLLGIKSKVTPLTLITLTLTLSFFRAFHSQWKPEI